MGYIVDDYAALIARKSAYAAPVGLPIAAEALKPHLFPHQRDLVLWALRRGRAAVFADTGTGKSMVLLEWARIVSDLGRVLIVAPLAVGPQLAREALRFGVSASYARSDTGAGIVITNYEMLTHFDANQFVGVVWDESGIVKSHTGATKQRLIEMFAQTPFRLACTATPSPNDHTELGNHAELLGVRTRAEMLSEYFTHDGGSTSNWALKGHAVESFWRWVATWGAFVSMPSDLGHDDTAFILPELDMRDHVVDAPGFEMMIASTLAEQRRVRKGTIGVRVAKAAELVRAYADAGEQSIVWCELNDEQDTLAGVLGHLAVSIQGSTPDDRKLEMYEQWRTGAVKCLVSKAKIFGYGINMQHCHRVVFIGPSHSWEGTYQAIRRCHRFGQQHTVSVDTIRARADLAVTENYRRKERDHAELSRVMRGIVGEVLRSDVSGMAREFNDYTPTQDMVLPAWLVQGNVAP